LAVTVLKNYTILLCSYSCGVGFPILLYLESFLELYLYRSCCEHGQPNHSSKNSTGCVLTRSPTASYFSVQLKVKYKTTASQNIYDV